MADLPSLEIAVEKQPLGIHTFQVTRLLNVFFFLTIFRSFPFLNHPYTSNFVKLEKVFIEPLNNVHSLLVCFLRQSPLCNSGFPRAMHNRLLQTAILLPRSIKLCFSLLLSSQFGGGGLELLAQVAFLPQQLRNANLEQHLQPWQEAGGNTYGGQAAVHALPATVASMVSGHLYNCGLGMRKDIPAWS